MSARILKSLEIDNDKPDFQERHIPAPEQSLQVHNQLHSLLAARRETDSDLEELMTDHHQDGSKKIRNEDDVEREYDALSSRPNALNREMLTLYAEYLRSISDTAPALSQRARMSAHVARFAASCPDGVCRERAVGDSRSLGSSGCG